MIPRLIPRIPLFFSRTGIQLYIFTAQGKYLTEIQRAPDLAGVPDIANATIIGVLDVAENLFTDPLPADGLTRHYRARHVTAALEPSNWTCWFSAKPAQYAAITDAIEPVEPTFIFREPVTANDQTTYALDEIDPQCRIVKVEVSSDNGKTWVENPNLIAPYEVTFASSKSVCYRITYYNVEGKLVTSTLCNRDAGVDDIVGEYDVTPIYNADGTVAIVRVRIKDAANFITKVLFDVTSGTGAKQLDLEPSRLQWDVSPKVFELDVPLHEDWQITVEPVVTVQGGGIIRLPALPLDRIRLARITRVNVSYAEDEATILVDANLDTVTLHFAEEINGVLQAEQLMPLRSTAQYGKFVVFASTERKRFFRIYGKTAAGKLGPYRLTEIDQYIPAKPQLGFGGIHQTLATTNTVNIFGSILDPWDRGGVLYVGVNKNGELSPDSAGVADGFATMPNAGSFGPNTVFNLTGGGFDNLLANVMSHPGRVKQIWLQWVSSDDRDTGRIPLTLINITSIHGPDGRLIFEAVEAFNIKKRTISAQEIAITGIERENIVNGIIDQYKIENSALFDRHFTDLSVSARVLGPSAVERDKIAGRAITEAQIALQGLSNPSIFQNGVITNDLIAGNITGNKIAVNNLRELTPNLGILLTGRLNADSGAYLDLDAQGGNAVFWHPNFFLQASGSAYFKGQVGADSVLTGAIVAPGNVAPGAVNNGNIVVEGILNANHIRVNQLSAFKTPEGLTAPLGIQVSGRLFGISQNGNSEAFIDLDNQSNQGVFLRVRKGGQDKFWVDYVGDAFFNGTIGANVGLFNTGIIVGPGSTAQGGTSLDSELAQKNFINSVTSGQITEAVAQTIISPNAISSGHIAAIKLTVVQAHVSGGLSALTANIGAITAGTLTSSDGMYRINLSGGFGTIDRWGSIGWLNFTDPNASVFAVKKGVNLNPGLNESYSFRIERDGNAYFGGILEAAGGTFKGQVQIQEFGAGELLFVDSSGAAVAALDASSGLDPRWGSWQGLAIDTAGQRAFEVRYGSSFGHSIHIPGWLFVGGNAVLSRITEFHNGNNQYWNFILDTGGQTTQGPQMRWMAPNGGLQFRFQNDGFAGSVAGWGSYSDERAKENIKTIPVGSVVMRKLRPIEFEWKDKNQQAGKHHGFLAQEVREVIPAAVVESSNGDGTTSLFLVNDAIIPHLVSALQDIDSRLAVLERRGSPTPILT
jgi:hypothetical protein